MRVPITMLLLSAAVNGAMALEQGPYSTTNFGPYDVRFLSGGIGIEQPLPQAISEAGRPWSFSGWIQVGHAGPGRVIIAALGDVALAPTPCRCLVLDQGRLALEVAGKTELHAAGPIDAAWHAIAATYDGHVARLYLDGVEV